MTQEELKKLWDETTTPIVMFSFYEAKLLPHGDFVGRLKQEYTDEYIERRVRRSDAMEIDRYYVIPRVHTPYDRVRRGEERSCEEVSYFEEGVRRLSGRTIHSPINGNMITGYEMIRRFIALNDWGGGGPPACTEVPCPDEDIFREFLRQAEEAYVYDMAAALGFKIKDMKGWWDK